MEPADVFAALKGLVRRELVQCKDAIRRDDKRRALTELDDAIRKIQQIIDGMV